MSHPKKQKVYKITLRRKRAVKALARRSCLTLSNECLRPESKTRSYTINGIGKIVRKELKSMSTVQSKFCSENKELETLKYEDIIQYEHQGNRYPFQMLLLHILCAEHYAF